MTATDHLIDAGWNFHNVVLQAKVTRLFSSLRAPDFEIQTIFCHKRHKAHKKSIANSLSYYDSLGKVTGLVSGIIVNDHRFSYWNFLILWRSKCQLIHWRIFFSHLFRLEYNLLVGNFQCAIG